MRDLLRAAWLTTWRAARVYHRYEVRGFENLLGPAALIVAYHGRPLAFDQCMLTVEIHDRLGYLPHGVVHEAFATGVLARFVDELGLVTRDGVAIERAVARGEHVMVQPGGTREGLRSFRHRHRVDWGNRRGYLRMAVRHRMRIIPVAGAGVDDAFIGLNNHKAWIGLGLGGVWPASLPLPVKMTQWIGEAIEPREFVSRDDDDDGLARLHHAVSGAVQRLLDEANHA